MAPLHNTLETLTTRQVTAQQSRYQLERSESGTRTNLVKLHKDYETTIHQNALATAISYGKAGFKKSEFFLGFFFIKPTFLIVVTYCTQGHEQNDEYYHGSAVG